MVHAFCDRLDRNQWGKYDSCYCGVCHCRHTGLVGLRLHIKRFHTSAKHKLWRTNKPQLNSNFIFNVGLSLYLYTCKGKDKDKIQSRTGHEGPEGE